MWQPLGPGSGSKLGTSLPSLLARAPAWLLSRPQHQGWATLRPARGTATGWQGHPKARPQALCPTTPGPPDPAGPILPCAAPRERLPHPSGSLPPHFSPQEGEGPTVPRCRAAAAPLPRCRWLWGTSLCVSTEPCVSFWPSSCTSINSARAGDLVQTRVSSSHRPRTPPAHRRSATAVPSG